MAKSAIKIIMFGILSMFLICLDNQVTTLENTCDHILYVKSKLVNDGLIDENIWILNLHSKNKCQLTNSYQFDEVSPVWLSDSEFIFLLVPRSSSQRIKISIMNLKTSARRIFDIWRIDRSKEPFPPAGLAYSRGNIIYYSGFLLLKASLKTKNIKRVVPYELIHKKNIVSIDNFANFDEQKIVFFRAKQKTSSNC